MLSDDMRAQARTIAEISKTRVPTQNECDSFALNMFSFANRVQMMEMAAIPPEKRQLTIIDGGKSSCIIRNREP